ncbi:MAG: AraC family transcriptional regulator [Pseudomonadota bacterium]
MEKGSISIYFVHSALEPVLERGIDAADVLREAGLSPALLASPQARVTAHSFSTLWLGVARLLDDELFGQDSRRMKVGSFAMLCQTLVHCPTLGEALPCMTRFFNLLLDDFQCSVDSDERHARLVIRDRRAGPPRIFGYETLLMLQHGVACWLAGRRISVLSAAFAYPEPSRSAEYQRMYSEQLSFDREATSLTFDRACLDLPVVQNSATLRDFVRGAPANIVLKYKNSGGLAAQIRRRLRAAARTEWPDFDTLAHSLNKTPSTLRRRLEDEGQSFQAIKDQLRRDIAIDYLCHSRKSVTDIAAELGFAEASAFHRAFKKWTGAGPGEYRQRMRASGE